MRIKCNIDSNCVSFFIGPSPLFDKAIVVLALSLSQMPITILGLQMMINWASLENMGILGMDFLGFGAVFMFQNV